MNLCECMEKSEQGWFVDPEGWQDTDSKDKSRAESGPFH